MTKFLAGAFNLSIFVGVIFFIIYLGNIMHSMESLEERLRYEEPRLHVSGEIEEGKAIRETYVPAYSHIYVDGGKPQLMEATLSIRNISPDSKIILQGVDYYGTKGDLQKSFISEALQLPPMAVAEYLMEKRSIEGGSGASFVVRWSSDSRLTPLLVEAVMVGSNEEEPVSFISRGVER